MPDHPHNRLRIVTLAPEPGQSHGHFLLTGVIERKRIRQRHHVRSVLESRKEQLEHALLAKQPRTVDKMLRLTWLDEDQLRRAEEATKLAGSKSVVEMVRAAIRANPDLEPKVIAEAVTEYVDTLKKLRRFPVTIANNKRRLKAFFRTVRAVDLGDVTAADVERHVLRIGPAPRTLMSDGRVLRSFFRYCVSRGWILKSPMQVNLANIGTKAHDELRRPKIRTPEECAALVKAAAERDNGEMLPYLGRALFCFMRHGEALRTPLENLVQHGEQWLFQVFSRKRGTKSDRTVTVPPNAVEWVKQPVVWSRARWDALREAAGLLERAPNVVNKRRKHLVNDWEENMLRHTGMSYFHQRNGNDIELARQAGDTVEVAHASYIRLPKPGDADKFYEIRATVAGAPQEPRTPE